MSVLELTLSYTRSITEGEFETPALTYRQKRTFTIAGFSFFVFLIMFYLYLMGAIVTKNYERNSLLIRLEQASSRTQEIEQQALGTRSIYTADYFIEQGYIKPKTLETIKRDYNVAAAQISRLY